MAKKIIKEFDFGKIRFGTKFENADMDELLNEIRTTDFALNSDGFWDNSACQAIRCSILHLYYKNRKVPSVDDVSFLLNDFRSVSELEDILSFPHISEEELFGNNPLKASYGEYLSKSEIGELGNFLIKFNAEHGQNLKKFNPTLDNLLSAIKDTQRNLFLEFDKLPVNNLQTHPVVSRDAENIANSSMEAREIILKRAICLVIQRQM